MSIYNIEKGLRKVPPYYHNFETFVKQRWLGRSALDVLVNDLKERSEAEYKEDINDGLVKIIRDHHKSTRFTIEGEEVGDTLMKDNDILVNRSHRHEPPVTVGEKWYELSNGKKTTIPIIHEDPELYVINKPSGIPVHPVGKFYHNTIIEILKNEAEITKLHPIQRLDRLTSGILVLPRTNRCASNLKQLMDSNQWEKEYVARVIGEFPESEEVICNDPIFSIHPGLGKVRKIPKKAQSMFTRISYNPELNQSIVRCKPITGRTHQLRIHLRNLGFPIVNDPIYGPMGSKMRNESELELLRRYNNNEKMTGLFDKFKALKDEFEDVKYKSLSGQKCPDCGKELYIDREEKEHIMWLHSRKLSFSDGSYSFEAEMPDWCYF